MNINNMLPSRGHNPQRLETDAHALRDAVESTRARKSNLRRIGVPLAVTVAIAGAGGVAAAAILNLGHIEHAPNGKTWPISNNLQMTISTDHGAVGSKVRVNVTGCYQPQGEPGLAFLSDADTNYGAMQNEHDFPVHMTNGAFATTVTIPTDASATAQFWVVCGGSNVRKPFHTTNPATAPACTAADVKATMAQYGGAAAGTFIIPITFTNTSDHTCWLTGFPTSVRLAQFNGQFTPAISDGIYGSTSTPMAPGQTTKLPISVTSNCTARPAGGPTVSRRGHIQVDLAGQWVTAASGLTQWDIGCGLHYGNYTNGY